MHSRHYGSYKNRKIVLPKQCDSLPHCVIQYDDGIHTDPIDGSLEVPSDGREVPKWMTEGEVIDGFVAVTENGVMKRGDGFSVSPGNTPNTQGILFWDKPFILHGADGVDRCLLIMDTQGLWDRNTSDEFNNYIFGLSSFLCSYLIFNNKGMFDNDRLKSFTKLSVFNNGLSDDSKAFQHLDILLRDFGDYDTNLDGIREAIEYSKMELQDIRSNKNLEKEVEAIDSCFEEFDLFCLPSPGEIAGRGFTGSIGSIRRMFMRILGFYIDKVIKNIQPRKFHGEELTVRAFTEYE